MGPTKTIPWSKEAQNGWGLKHALVVQVPYYFEPENVPKPCIFSRVIHKLMVSKFTFGILRFAKYFAKRKT